jgi:hypothetical protein
LQKLSECSRGKKDRRVANKLLRDAEASGSVTPFSNSETRGRKVKKGKTKKRDYEPITPSVHEDEEDRDSVMVLGIRPMLFLRQNLSLTHRPPSSSSSLSHRRHQCHPHPIITTTSAESHASAPLQVCTLPPATHSELEPSGPCLLRSRSQWILIPRIRSHTSFRTRTICTDTGPAVAMMRAQDDGNFAVVRLPFPDSGPCMQRHDIITMGSACADVPNRIISTAPLPFPYSSLVLPQII